MKNWFVLFLIVVRISAASQNVGINTNNPATTLQVIGQPATATIADGVTIPKITGDQLKAKDAKYTSTENGTLVYVTAAVGTSSAKTVNVTAIGFYYFDGAVWQRVANGLGNDVTNDEWINDNASTVVKLGKKSDGTTARAAETDFLANDNGNVDIGLAGTGSTQARLHIYSSGNNVNTPVYMQKVGTGVTMVLARANIGTAATATTPAIPTALPVASNLGQFVMTGYDGTGWADGTLATGGASVLGTTVNAWTATDHGTLMKFGTTPRTKLPREVHVLINDGGHLIATDIDRTNSTSDSEAPGQFTISTATGNSDAFYIKAPLVDVTNAATAAALPSYGGSAVAAVTPKILAYDSITGKVGVAPAASFGAIATKSAAYTATPSDETILVDASSASITITLPTTVATGKRYVVKLIKTTGGNTVTVTAGGTIFIDGSTSITNGLVYQGWVMQWDGASWWIVSRM